MPRAHECAGAATLTAPPHALQVVISMSPKATTFGEYSLEASPQGAYFRFAHVIAMDGMYAGFAGANTGHRCMTFCGCYQSTLLAIRTVRRPGEHAVTQRLERIWTASAGPRSGRVSGMIRANRVRACPGLDPGLTLGFGTRAASRAMKSCGSKMTWVVPYPPKVGALGEAFAGLMGQAFSIRCLQLVADVVVPECDTERPGCFALLILNDVGMLDLAPFPCSGYMSRSHWQIPDRFTSMV